MKKFKKIYIEITNICNLNCSFCSKVEKERRMLSTTEFKEIKRRVAYKCYDWLLQCRSGRKILSLKYLPKALCYCNVEILRIAIIHLYDKLMRIVKKQRVE